MTPACSACFLLHALICFYIHRCMVMVLYRLMQAIVGGCPHKPSRFLAAPVNDKRQLIKGLLLWEMYPSLRLLNQSQPCKGEGIPKGCRGSYVLISWIFLHGDGDYTKNSEKIAHWIAADSKRKIKITWDYLCWYWAWMTPLKVYIYIYILNLRTLNPRSIHNCAHVFLISIHPVP